MSCKTVRDAVLHALQDLKKEKFLEFCHKLTDTEEEPHIRAYEVEDKSRVQITELLVSRWADEAQSRTVEILTNIGCHKEARDLAKKCQQTPKRDRSKTPPPQFSSDEAKPGKTSSQDMSEKQLLQVAKLLGKEWKQVAIYLDLSSQELEDIQANEADVTMQKMTMLLKWRSRRGPGKATASDLWDSIRDLDDLPGDIALMLQGEVKRDFLGKRPPQFSSAAGASGAPAQQKHFVDRHEKDLIDRVTNMGPILDHLLQKGVLGREQYDQARKLATTYDQMRFLFSGPLKAGGDRSKDVLMAALEREENYLLRDLKKEG